MLFKAALYGIDSGVAGVLDKGRLRASDLGFRVLSLDFNPRARAP